MKSGDSRLPNSEPKQGGVTRRRFMVGTASLALSIGLSGCGGSGSGGTNAPATAPAAVLVLTMEVGSGTFLLTTSYQSAASVMSSGGGTVVVSTTDTQHVFLTDSSGVLRALALSIPGNTISIGAESTLLGALFLVPGILTRDSKASVGRVAFLKTLASYQAALTYVRGQLPTVPYQTLVKDATFNTLCLTVARDFIAGYKGRGIINIGQGTDDFFRLDFTGPNPPPDPASVGITMTNGAWRNLRVDRILTDASGAVLETRKVKKFPSQMGGGVGVSYGAILTGSIGTPDVEADPTPIDFTKAAHAQYWVQGVGFNAGGTPPPSIDTDDSAAWGSSAIAYMVFPLVSMLIPIAKGFPGAGAVAIQADDVWEVINLDADVETLATASDDLSRSIAGKTLLVDALFAAVKHDAFVAAGFLSAVENEVLGGFLDLVTLGFGIFIVGLVFDKWSTYTRREYIQIDSLGGGKVGIQ